MAQVSHFIGTRNIVPNRAEKKFFLACMPKWPACLAGLARFFRGGFFLRAAAGGDIF
jgi:hypothetical protein